MKKNAITLYEFDAILPAGTGAGHAEVPVTVFAWLEEQCLRMDAAGAWLKLTKRNGHKAIQVTSFVGVIRAPQGFQIEVLPKIGKVIDGGEKEVRQLLLEMLRCLNGFRHIQMESALLAAAKMPLLEVFIGEFLLAVEQVVKRGLRSDYISRQDNLFVLRGKLLVAQQIRQNLHRADRFCTEHDEFSPNRPENRLLHAALRRVLAESATQTNQRLARELCFIFAEIPASTRTAQDFQQIRLDRRDGILRRCSGMDPVDPGRTIAVDGYRTPSRPFIVVSDGDGVRGLCDQSPDEAVVRLLSTESTGPKPASGLSPESKLVCSQARLIDHEGQQQPACPGYQMETA